MPAFDVARRWKGRVVLDRDGGKLRSVLDVFYDAEHDEPGGGGRLYAYWGLAYTGASLVDLEEEDEEAVAPVRGLPPR